MASLVYRAALQHAARAAPGARAASHAATAGGHGGGHKLWKKVSFFVAFPAIGLGMLNAYLAHQEHAHDPHPEFVPMEYLCIRTKRFPWGDGVKTLFHNPHVNPLPTGYEDH